MWENFLHLAERSPADIIDLAQSAHKVVLRRFIGQPPLGISDGARSLHLGVTHTVQRWPPIFDGILHKPNLWAMMQGGGKLQERIATQFVGTIIAEFKNWLPGRELSKFDLDFFRQKARSWRAEEHFSKFWEWFVSAVQLLQRCALEWQCGLIFGFITRQCAHTLLSAMPVGRFLLRISSQKDSFAISYVVANGTVMHTEVQSNDDGFRPTARSDAAGKSLCFATLWDLIAAYGVFETIHPTGMSKTTVLPSVGVTIPGNSFIWLSLE